MASDAGRVVFVGCCLGALLAFASGVVSCEMDRGSQESDGGSDEPPLVTEFRPEFQLFSGTDVIDLVAPARCEPVDSALAALTFEWTPSGEPRVYVGVFSVRPTVKDGAIEQPDTAVWAWMNGDDRPDVGQVTWARGFVPDARGFPDLSQQGPPPPAPGTYWLASWAWNAQRTLTRSSETRPFFWLGEGGTLTEADCCDLQREAGEEANSWCLPEVHTDGGAPPLECWQEELRVCP